MRIITSLFKPLLLVIAFSYISCTKSETSYMKNDADNVFTISSKISLDEAFLIASGNNGQTKGLDVDITPILEGNDTVLYLINYPQGWSVMPADRRLPSALITCDEGHITLDELLANDSAEYYVKSLMNEVKELVSHPEDISLDAFNTKASTPPMSFYEDGTWWTYVSRYESSTTTDKIQNSLILTKWGQGDAVRKWNINAPYTDINRTDNCPTGCTSVAFAQVLYYLHTKTGFPAQTYRDFGSVSFCLNGNNNEPYPAIITDHNTYKSDMSDCWSDMPHIASTSLSNSDYAVVSSLMVRLGYLFESEYYPTKTNTRSDYIVSGLYDGFGITCSKSGYSVNTLPNQIYTLKLPVVLNMSRIDSNGNRSGGHTFIADGYKKVTHHYTFVYKAMDESSTRYKYINDAAQNSSEYVSLNWGHDGSGDRASTGAVIWYNMGTSYTYSGTSETHTYNNVLGDSEMFYNFSH